MVHLVNKEGFSIKEHIEKYSFIYGFVFVAFLASVTFAIANQSQLITLFSNASSTGRTLYVSSSGNDSNSGSKDSPLRTIQKAADAVEFGDTVIISEGSYPTFKIQDKKGIEGAPITFKAESGAEHKVIVDNKNVSSGYGIRINNSHHIVIDSLSVTNVQKAIFVDNSQNITLQKNKIYTIGMEAIHLMRNSAYVKVLNNEIFDIGKYNSKYSEGVYVGNGSYPGAHNVAFPDNTHDILISGNHIYNNGAVGGEPINIKGETYNVTIEKNVIHDFKVPTGGGISFDTLNNWEITKDRNHIVRDNVVYNITDDTVYGDANGISVKAQHVSIYNNVLYNNADFGIRISDSQSVNQLVKVYNNTIKPASGKDGIGISSGVDYLAKNNIGTSLGENAIPYSDDLFVNATIFDFRLKEGSLAIDKGAVVSEVNTDSTRTPRPQLSGYDIGAYEFIAAVPVVTQSAGVTATPYIEPTVPIVPSKTPTPTNKGTISPAALPTTIPTKTPLPTVPIEPLITIESLTLLDAESNQPVSGYNSLRDGTSINLASLPSRTINFRANTNPSQIGSVKFYLNGVLHRLENSSPYSFYGDKDGDYLPWTPEAGVYTLSAVPYSAANGLGTQGQPYAVKITVSDKVALNGDGLRGSYYDDTQLRAYKGSKIDSTINFNWGSGSPMKGVSSDTFAVIWNGYIIPEYSQEYTFYTNTDDGSRLWINNQLIIEKWFDHGTREYSAKIMLQAGKRYPIRLDYYDNKRGAIVQLYWSSPSVKKQIIPQKNLYSE